jgi:colanic acid/amylovoran biosynthesis glycosyltransferase
LSLGAINTDRRSAEVSANMTLGYMVPEFPGQTHSFFWREIRELERLGQHVDIVSTRIPPKDIISHGWSSEAMTRTTYLWPPKAAAIYRAAKELLRSGPKGWARCIQAAAIADAPLGFKLRILAMVLPGATLAARARVAGWSHVHVHSCANAAVVAMQASLLAGITYSLTLHSALPTFGPAQRTKWRHAAFGISVNQQMVKALELDAGVPPEKLSVAAMGVDLDIFSRRQPYERPLGKGPWRLVSCGRLHRGKGHQDLVAAVEQLRNDGFDVSLSILGEGPARAMLEILIRAKQLEQVVRLAGAVDESQVRDALEGAHLFVLGSHDEAIGVATMEAMAMGLPVVVTNVGGVPELVRQGVDGLLVEPGRPDQMAEAIRRILSDSDQAQRMGEAGMQRVRASFSSRRSAEVLVRRLTGLAGEKVARRAPAEVIL